MSALPEDVREFLAELAADDTEVEGLRADVRRWKELDGLQAEKYDIETAIQARELLNKYDRTEAESLAAIVAERWAKNEWRGLTNCRRGDDIGGFVYIDEQDGKTDHNHRRDDVNVIVRGPSGQHYAWTYFRSYLPEGLDPEPSWPAGGLPSVTAVHAVEETETRVAHITRWVSEDGPAR